MIKIDLNCENLYVKENLFSFCSQFTDGMFSSTWCSFIKLTLGNCSFSKKSNNRAKL